MASLKSIVAAPPNDTAPTFEVATVMAMAAVSSTAQLRLFFLSGPPMEAASTSRPQLRWFAATAVVRRWFAATAVASMEPQLGWWTATAVVASMEPQLGWWTATAVVALAYISQLR